MIALASLALATLAFVGTHLALSHPLRTRILQNVGEQGFVLLYSGVALVTFVWMVLSYGAVRNSFPLWSAPDWSWPIFGALMLLACILLAGAFSRNPAFPRPGAPPLPPREATGMFAVTRHPMNMAFALWGIVHVSMWGTPRNIILGSGILVLALVGSAGQDRKKLDVVGEPWRIWMERTSFLPFGALLARRAAWRDILDAGPAIMIGLLAWLAITFVHFPEVNPLALLLYRH